MISAEEAHCLHSPGLLTCFCFCVCLAASSIACDLEDSQALSQKRLDQYHGLLSLSRVESFYYNDPQVKAKVPLVKGSLSNLGAERLSVVELTLKFKNQSNEIIYVDKAYPVYVSEYSMADTRKCLEPGQNIRFAFKSPACPHTWKPGQVDVEISKVVIARP